MDRDEYERRAAEQYAVKCAEVTRLTAEVQRLRGVYDELIYAVGNKYDGETRHQTALRYIRQAESHDGSPGQAALSTPPAPTTEAK
jgi:hypothetical protein